MTVWRLSLAAVFIAIAIALVWLSSVPGRAFKAEEQRLQAGGYALLSLSRVNDPLNPRSLYLTCRNGAFGLSGVVVMPAHELIREHAGFPDEILLGPSRTTIFLYREPFRLGTPKIETFTRFTVRRRLDHLEVGQLDKAVVSDALLQLRIDRLSLISLDQAFEFPLRVDPARTKTFLDRCT